MPLKNPRSLRRSPSHDALRLLKGALDALVADERALEGRGDSTHRTPAQKSLYAHPCQDSRTSDNRALPKRLATPPPYQHPDGVPPIGSRPSLSRCTIYSGQRSGPECSKRPNPSDYRGSMHGSAYELLRTLLL